MTLEEKVEINSFDLARKMHELYKEYNCEQELPEYEDLAKISKKNKIPLKKIYEEANKFA